MAHTQYIETTSEKIANRKNIRYLEFETREFLEREKSNKNIENIVYERFNTKVDVGLSICIKRQHRVIMEDTAQETLLKI